jgi:HEAT repeat protein
MRASFANCRPPAILRWLALLLVLGASTGCTWGSKNGVPWWGSKKDKQQAADDLAHYGPFAFQRIQAVLALEKFAAKGSEADKQKVADELAREIRTEEDPLVRAQIVRTLSTVPNRTSQFVLTQGVKDPDPDVRVQICKAWGTMAKQAAGVRKGAVAPAGSVEDSAVQTLAGTLASDTNADVRMAAARALGNVPRDPRVAGALALALRDNDPAMQYEAIVSLKASSGQDFGGDVTKWQQYAASIAPAPPPGQSQPPAVASRPQY